MASLFGQLILPELNTLNGILVGMNFLQIPAALQEALGKNMPYSKFAHGAVAGKKTVSTRLGMIIIYGPALIVSMSAMAHFMPADIQSRFKGNPTGLWNFLFNSRPLLVSICMWLHYLKRELEVLTVHSYSGTMELSTAASIAVAYTIYASAAMWHFVPAVPAALYASTAHVVLPELGGSVPIASLVGFVLFLAGQYGNFHHHRILARLRLGGSKVYAIPQGGLFSLLVCPHYVFELVAWLGLAIISQHIYLFAVATAMTAYLLGRTIATRTWYRKKFENFPASRKLIIPFIL